MRKLFILLFSLFILSSLSACGTASPVLKPFKMDIQQGNVVTSKMLLQLRPGMTKSQVRFIMGTPLIVDSFHKDRWDYFYQLRQAGKVVEQRRVILDFDKELLSKVRGDVVPAGTPGAATGEIAVSKSIKTPKEEAGLLDQLKFWKKDEKTPVAAVAAVKPEAVKPKIEEKGLLDKLKFWKKDAVADAKSAEAGLQQAKPIEAPHAVLSEPVVENNTSSDVSVAPEEAVSVLAVPIEIGASSVDVPTNVDLPKIETPKVEAPKIEAPKIETPRIETPSVIPPKVAPVKLEPPKTAAPAPAQNKPVQPIVKNKQDEKMIFRMDRTLKTELLEQEIMPKPASPAIEAPAVEKPSGQNLTKPKQPAGEPVLPAETEPSFFDKMLEKIGF